MRRVGRTCGESGIVGPGGRGERRDGGWRAGLAEPSIRAQGRGSATTARGRSSRIRSEAAPSRGITSTRFRRGRTGGTARRRRVPGKLAPGVRRGWRERGPGVSRRTRGLGCRRRPRTRRAVTDRRRASRPCGRGDRRPAGSIVESGRAPSLKRGRLPAVRRDVGFAPRGEATVRASVGRAFPRRTARIVALIPARAPTARGLPTVSWAGPNSCQRPSRRGVSCRGRGPSFGRCGGWRRRRR